MFAEKKINLFNRSNVETNLKNFHNVSLNLVKLKYLRFATNQLCKTNN